MGQEKETQKLLPRGLRKKENKATRRGHNSRGGRGKRVKDNNWDGNEIRDRNGAGLRDRIGNTGGKSIGMHRPDKTKREAKRAERERSPPMVLDPGASMDSVPTVSASGGTGDSKGCCPASEMETPRDSKPNCSAIAVATPGSAA